VKHLHPEGLRARAAWACPVGVSTSQQSGTAKRVGASGRRLELATDNGGDRDGPAGPQPSGPHPPGPQPSRRDKRLYLVLMTVCIGLFVLSWAVLDRYSVTAAIVVSAVALVIPPFAVIIANAASAVDRRRP
jgi:hypothetical protein